MVVGTGGQSPQIFSTKTTTFKSVYRNKDKYAHSAVDIGNHRYTNVHNCILLKYKCD